MSGHTKKTIIITGATGFLGSVLIPRISKDNASIKNRFNVVCLVPDSETVRMAGGNISEDTFLEQCTKLGIKVVKYPAHGRADDYRTALADIKKISAVVYMAANNNQVAKYDELYEDNAAVLKIFIDSLGSRLQNTSFIFTSSVMAKTCKTMMNSGYDKEIIKKINPYGLSKLMAEKIIIEQSKKFRFRPVVLRLASLYGKNSATGFMLTIENIGKISKKFPTPKFPGKVGILEVNDASKVLSKLALEGKVRADTYYVDNCNSKTVGELIRIRGTQNGFTTKQFNVPKFAVKITEATLSKGAKYGISAAHKILALFNDNFVDYDTRIWSEEEIVPQELSGISKKIAKKKKLKIAITGASGLIGEKLSSELLEKGFFVRCGVFRNSTIKFSRQNIEIMKCDVQDPESVESFVHGQDVVIHAAALTTSRGKEKKDEYFRTNVGGTHNVVNACRKNGIKSLIFFSSQAAHGSAKGNYGKSKYQAEKIVAKSKLEWIILKPGQVISEKSLIPKLSSKIKKGTRFIPIPASTPKNLELIDINLLVKETINVLNNRKKLSHKFIYLGCSERVSVEQIADKLSEILNKNPKRIRIPKWTFKTLAVITPINSDMIDGMYTPMPKNEKNSIRLADEPWENILERIAGNKI